MSDLHSHARGPSLDDRDLMALADGRIESESPHAASVRAYLADHPEDAERVSAWQQQNDAIRAHYTPVLSEAVPERLLPQQLRAQRARQQRSQLRAAMAASVAAVALAGVVSAAVWHDTGSDTELDRFAAEVATISGDVGPASAAAASTAASQSGQLPDLDAMGFSLTDQRIVRAGDRTATEARYEDAQGHALQLFVAEDRGADGPTLHRRAQDGRDIVYWRAGDRLYALSASDALQPGRLEAIATATLGGSLGRQLSSGSTLAGIQGDASAAPGNAPIVTMDDGRQRATEPATGNPTDVHYEGLVKDSSL